MAAELPRRVPIVSTTLRTGPVRVAVAGRPGPKLGQVTSAAGRGAPREGKSGAVAPAGPRLGAFAVDIVLSALVAGIFTAPELPRNRSLLVFAVLYFGFTVLAQQTPGMRLLRLRVVRVDRSVPIGLWRSVVRTVGVILVIPAVLRDEHGRSVHDRLTQTAVVRS
jgi:uncharacterized RDD family membrane protein YckC